jgi:hypothetical protein
MTSQTIKLELDGVVVRHLITLQAQQLIAKDAELATLRTRISELEISLAVATDIRKVRTTSSS